MAPPPLRHWIRSLRKTATKGSKAKQRPRPALETLEARWVPAIVISEVDPSGSSRSYAADWFEVTNTGPSAVNITGWKMDDNSNGSPASAQVALNGITSIAPGESVIFLETSNLTATRSAFLTAWFGASAPAGLQIGSYSGSGVGLSTSGDAVNLFDAAGNRVTGVAFGAAPASATFDNTLGLGSATLP